MKPKYFINNFGFINPKVTITGDRSRLCASMLPSIKKYANHLIIMRNLHGIRTNYNPIV